MTRRTRYSVCLDCPELIPKGTAGGRCPRHAAAKDRSYIRRGSAVYRSPRWAGIRRLVLRRDKFCTWPDGCNVIATDADHYPVPVDECADPFDPAGIRGLCHRHHSRATMSDLRDRGVL